MNRNYLVAILGILVHNGIMSLPAADHYLNVMDKTLEDGDTLQTMDSVLEALNG